MSSESALRAKTLRKNILHDIEQLLKLKAVPAPKVVATSSSGGLLDLKRDLLDLSSLALAVPRENIILEELYFESLDSHERAIVDAENGTFEWLFGENGVQDNNDVKVIEEVKPLNLVDEHEQNENDVSSIRSVTVEILFVIFVNTFAFNGNALLNLLIKLINAKSNAVAQQTNNYYLLLLKDTLVAYYARATVN
ncbi:hypothetical protein IQ07DRAFT_669064 [Pyrenochaeta sp. DS3sAY3a]|nr:hypothetical protein IQ07DRAFT_669064 [Pyrenochaeta sp. DS3sAY3a]